MKTPTLKTCAKGHQFYKSSSCPVCPVCEKLKGSTLDFLQALSAPARRALERAKVNSLQQLATWREADLLALHGVGPASIPKLKALLEAEGLRFRA